MTSGMRHILSEALLWLSVFIIALAAFFYLDNRLEAYMDHKAQNQQQSDEQAGMPKTGNEQQDQAQRQDNSSYGRVVLQAGRSGHFEVRAYINNNSINLMADTGATYVVLSYEDADTLGLTYNLNFSGRARTANGVSKVAPIMLETVEVGDIQVDNVQAVVAEEGKLKHSLLGMSFIGRLDSFQMSGRELVLVQ